METELMSIGRRIKMLRIEREVSQADMAKRIGMSQTNLSNVESGRTTATIPVLLKIRKVLGCRMADFFVDLDNGVAQGYQNREVKNTASEYVTKGAIEIEDALKILKLLKAVEIKGL